MKQEMFDVASLSVTRSATGIHGKGVMLNQKLGLVCLGFGVSSKGGMRN